MLRLPDAGAACKGLRGPGGPFLEMASHVELLEFGCAVRGGQPVPETQPRRVLFALSHELLEFDEERPEWPSDVPDEPIEERGTDHEPCRDEDQHEVDLPLEALIVVEEIGGDAVELGLTS